MAKADTGRERDLGFAQRELAELQRTHGVITLRDPSPNKHRPPWSFTGPTQAVQAVHKNVAPRLVGGHDLAHALLRTLHCNNRGDLDGLEQAVVQIGLHARQGRHNVRIADAEADAPAGHIIGLGHAEEFHCDVLGPGNLENRGRHVPVKDEVGVSEVMYHDDAVCPGELHHASEEVELHRLARGIMGEGKNEMLRPRPRLVVGIDNALVQVTAGRERNRTHVCPGDDHGIEMDGIGGIRHKRHVAGFHNSQREMGKPLFDPDNNNRFRFRIDRDIKSAAVPVRNRESKFGYAARGGITMIAGLPGSLDQLLHHVRGCGEVWIPHPKVDDVFSLRASLALELVDNVEHIGGQALYPVELVHAPHLTKENGRNSLVSSFCKSIQAPPRKNASASRFSFYTAPIVKSNPPFRPEGRKQKAEGRVRSLAAPTAFCFLLFPGFDFASRGAR